MFFMIVYFGVTRFHASQVFQYNIVIYSSPENILLFPLSRKKQERLQKASENLQSQESINDTASITSSRASRPWIKDPLADAKPITDPLLRQKLPSNKTKVASKVRTVTGNV